MNSVRNRRHNMNRHRLTWGVTLAALFLGACVLPGEFDDLDNTCEGQRFDATSRDAFCSGSWSSRAVSVDGLSQELQAASKPLVHIQGDWLTTVQSVNEGQSVSVNVFKKDTLGRYLPELSRTLTLPVNPNGGVGQLTSAVMMGLSEDRPADQSVLALVQNRRELVMLDVGDQRGGVSLTGADPLTIDVYRDQDWVAPEIKSKCFEGGGDQEFADLATFSPGDSVRDERQYVVVAAGCAMMVYGYEPNLLPEPTVLAQFSSDAVDVEIDEANDRMLIATGFQGLSVRSLSDFRRDIDEKYEELTLLTEAAQGSPTVGGDGTNDDTENSLSRDSFSPGFDPGSFTAVDPSVNALINVTKVGFSGDRVFFINEATLEDDGYNGLTYLVAGRLNASGTFEEKTSVPVSNDDFSFDNVSWELVSLKDSYFAVLRNSEKQIGSDTARNSQVKLFDAPAGRKPTEVFSIPTTRFVSTIVEEGNELWVIQDDVITAYDFAITGPTY